MNLLRLMVLSLILIPVTSVAQDNVPPILNDSDFLFLEELTLAVLESSRIYPGQTISPRFGPNNTGGILIRPGGRNAYPAFWIRDYAMSLESGLIGQEEQKHMLLLTAGTQCDQTWITSLGSLVPSGAIPDHIRIDDGLPIFFPGTYDYERQGHPRYGRTQPYGDQFFFIHMAWNYVKQTGDETILQQEIRGMKLLDRLELAFRVPPAGKDHLVFTTDEFRGVDFGFRDVQEITGYLCFPSILKIRAAREMADLMEKQGSSDKARSYREIAYIIRQAIPEMFRDERGMLRASTEKSSQPDVWSTALAVYLDAIPHDPDQKACNLLAAAYKEGTLACRGSIRHILTTDDFNDATAWEFSQAKKNTYQNGAYWGTPTGWVCYAIDRVDKEAAIKLAREYVDDLMKTDYRKGEEYGGPFECFHPGTGDLRNPVYLTTVSCPYAVFKKMTNK